MNYFQILQILAATTMILFVPGLIVSFVMFKPTKIDWIERVALSFALSIAIVPLVAFYANLLGIKISTENILIEVLCVCMIAGILLPFRYMWGKNTEEKLSRPTQKTVVTSVIKTTDKKLILTTQIVLRELFQISLVTYLILLLSETVKPGFVTFFFNLHILLAVVLISGIGMILTQYQPKSLPTIWGWRQVFSAVEFKTKKTKKVKLTKWDLYFILAVSIGGGILVYYKTQDILQGFSLLIAAVTTVVIALLSYLIFVED